MQLDRPLDLGSIPDALRTALYTFARLNLTDADTTVDENGHLAAPESFSHPEYDKLEEAAGAWRAVRETLDKWRAQCPPENLAAFDALTDEVLPREGSRHYDAFHLIRGTGEEYRVLSRLYLISVQGIAGEYASMMLDGVSFASDGRITSAPEKTDDPWEF